MENKENNFVKSFTKAFCEEVKGEKLFVISNDVEDRQGEVLALDGWDLENYKKNPVILWAHNDKEPAIGKGTDIKFRTINGKKQLTFKPFFHKKSDLSRLISDLVEDGIINATSVGFLPKEMDGNTYTKQELLEVSMVNVPANAGALGLAMSKGYTKDLVSKVLDVEEEKEEKKESSVIEYKEYKKMPDDAEWNGKQVVADASIEDMKSISAWYDTEDKENKEAYKLPHHNIDGYKTNFNGVVKAMADLMGAKVEVPAEDVKNIYDHLAKHFEEFGKEAPAYKTADELINKHLQGIDVQKEVKTIQTSVNTLIDECKAFNGEMKAQYEKMNTELAEKVNILSDNLNAAAKGLNPKDEGIEARFEALENNIVKIANILQDKSSDGDEGREPVSTKENRDIAMKALNKSIEALNRAFKK